ncbi:hypothetical protein K493DRAFT_314946 [Basidiobolus meristosporus CBS 931.73]|uniref:Amino acid transporter transmembrane domain-containing protein n=1 Tax=Basidiobolus meristosporus CBS 931.73 TaxID=1314790 RepID=A0A1Y1YC76_9FUNG|nr:hypothetical protein K493DRAFT_314946 [Basidiobolus meristosporus CBS 931.73]|eukprot:ORX95588.1 hypothetical protein K493DRAFT_314946 [Basidiobolus meristosporus CBS 931.73]
MHTAKEPTKPDTGLAANSVSSGEVNPITEVSQPGSGESSITEVAFNLLNTIIGSGILGLPFALKDAGFFAGILVLIFVAVINDFALRILVQAGRRTGIYQFHLLAKKTLGNVGFYFLNLVIWTQSVGSTISYVIIIGDTVPLLASIYLPSLTFLHSRAGAILVTNFLFILPLLFWRSMAPLAKFSIISILCLPIISLTVAVRAPYYAGKHTVEYNFVGDNLFPAIGVISFAFVCTQTCFMNFMDLRNPTDKRWSKTTKSAIAGAFLIYTAFALIGYLSFGSDVKDNIFKNFPSTDPYINFARLCLVITMFLTYPMLFYPARSTLNVLLGFEDLDMQPTSTQHLSVTMGLYTFVLFVGLSITNLGKVYQLIGAFSATGLAYLVPAGIYLATFRRKQFDFLRLRVAPDASTTEPLVAPTTAKQVTGKLSFDVAAIVLVCFGLVALVTGTGKTLLDIIQGQ